MRIRTNTKTYEYQKKLECYYSLHILTFFEIVFPSALEITGCGYVNLKPK